ncbi:MAG TPA: hypothetical protein VGB25_01800 [Candidatus Binatia bacterium]
MFKRLLLFLAVPFLLGSAMAVEPEQVRFVSEYVEAVNAKDRERLMGLIHPEYRACMTEDNQDYFDDYFSRELNEVIPSGYRIVGVKSIGPDEPLLMPDALSYPVKPSHWIQIDFPTGPYSSKRVLRQIVKFDDRWLMVVPCPKGETVQKYREAKKAKEKAKERAMTLLGKMEEPLRGELLSMFNEGRKINAWKRYSAATGESLSMAKEVLSLLTESLEKEKTAELSSPGEPAPARASAAVGKSYRGLEELKKDQESNGYVFLGDFGDSWPAEIKEVQSAMNGISFEIHDGVRQVYSGYDGYEVVLLRLRAGDDREDFVIFRSMEKK